MYLHSIQISLIFTFLLFFIIFMCVSILPACSAYEGEKRVLDPVELELWTTLSQCVGAGNHTQVF